MWIMWNRYWVSNPEAGIWTIEVDGTTVPSGPQTYSLVTDSITGNDGSKSFTIFNDGDGMLSVSSMTITDGKLDFFCSSRAIYISAWRATEGNRFHQFLESPHRQCDRPDRRCFQ